jgi:FkbM family methyltransferase
MTAKTDHEALAAKRRAFLKRLSGFIPSDAGGAEIVALDYPAADLYLYVTSRAEKKSRAFSCSKEPWTVAWIERAMTPGEIVYDIGANVGAYSLIAARRVAPGGRVYACEPGYATFAHLCDNIVLNGCEAVITPLSIGLAASTGIVPFAYHKLYPGHARHRGFDAGSPSDDAEPAYRQPVPAMRMDDLVCTFGLLPPNHIKVDVDGGELAVLEGAERTLAHPGLKSVLLEVDDRNSAGAVDMLRRAGLYLSDRFDRTEEGSRQPFWYGVFERACPAVAHGEGSARRRGR